MTFIIIGPFQNYLLGNYLPSITKVKYLTKCRRFLPRINGNASYFSSKLGSPQSSFCDSDIYTNLFVYSPRVRRGHHKLYYRGAHYISRQLSFPFYPLKWASQHRQCY